MVGDYKSISQRKIQERDAKIPDAWKLSKVPTGDNLLQVPETCGILTPREIEITGTYDSVDLLKKIHSGEFTAEEVTIAFCKRASIAQQLLNCLTEILFEEAIAVAQKQDEYFKRTGEVVGPLHGLPISLKDSMNIKGVDSSISITALAFQPEKEDSGVTTALLKAGAIIFCKTNVPQSMMVLDTDNFTFGRCRNPHSEFITAAGSSGGAGKSNVL
ncbi:Amd2p [Sugiyamaella lignohabitans]|uniref:Amd2p n=1 Tax=Sugiyamaella lignohabitans TaxID=796027 RepID=A0A161HM89_9ASCO|nr:Amd2p [Sugiyamaella lignohabitans]ANB14727.1 Amd2p [Sugiyamaella lignohabitans]